MHTKSTKTLVNEMKVYRGEVEKHAKSETEKHIAFIGLTGKEAEAYRAGSSLGCTVSCHYLDILEKKINTKRRLKK